MVSQRPYVQLPLTSTSLSLRTGFLAGLAAEWNGRRRWGSASSFQRPTGWGVWRHPHSAGPAPRKKSPHAECPPLRASSSLHVSASSPNCNRCTQGLPTGNESNPSFVSEPCRLSPWPSTWSSHAAAHAASVSMATSGAPLIHLLAAARRDQAQWPASISAVEASAAAVRQAVPLRPAVARPLQ